MLTAWLFYLAIAILLANAQIKIDHLKPLYVRGKLRENTNNISTQQWEEIARKVSNLSLDFMPTGKMKQPDIAGEIDVNDEVNTHIIAGSLAKRGFFPWQVGLKTDNELYCGGSLISAVWVLTAAHCAEGFTTFDVILGATNFHIKEKGRIIMTTTTQITHPNYNTDTVENDLAVLKLPRAVKFSKYIRPIRLPKVSEATRAFTGVFSTISGWGILKDNGNMSMKLRYVKLDIISNYDCAKTFGTIYPTTMCTSGASKQGVCQGDSGGPLVHKDNDGKFTQIGIVSFTYNTCVGIEPAGFTRVASFLGWISSTTGIAIKN